MSRTWPCISFQHLVSEILKPCLQRLYTTLKIAVVITEFVPTDAPGIVGPVDPVQPATPPPPPVPGNTEDPTWPTTEWPTTEWPTTEWPTDDDGEALQESGGGQPPKRGYYVAIGIGALLVIVIILIVVGIIVYKMKQRKSQKGKILT